jgi:hypothetical protein
MHTTLVAWSLLAKAAQVLVDAVTNIPDRFSLSRLAPALLWLGG